MGKPTQIKEGYNTNTMGHFLDSHHQQSCYFLRTTGIVQIRCIASLSVRKDPVPQFRGLKNRGDLE